jgi:Bacterial regulatory proteins, tetR family.
MDNKARSQRSRDAAINAALAIIARDGPGRLTLDAIARESGISKGGLMHHFRTKVEVLRALVDRQIDQGAQFHQTYLAGLEPHHPEAALSSQIAALRAAIRDPYPATFAILGALAEDPGLLSCIRDGNAEEIRAIRTEAADPDLATLRWMAAWGLMLTDMLGMSPLDEKEREKLFDRLLDRRRWEPQAVPSNG